MTLVRDSLSKDLQRLPGMMLTSRTKSLTLAPGVSGLLPAREKPRVGSTTRLTLPIGAKDAPTQPNTKATRELYRFSQTASIDVDEEKDGKVNAQEFDFLCEKVAFMPRRYGYSPPWEAKHGGSVKKRTAARKAMPDDVDSKQGPARGWIGAFQSTD